VTRSHSDCVAARLRKLRRRLCRVLRDDTGGVSAEFAVTLPVVAAVLVLCVASVALAAQQVQLSAVAAQVARVEARGDRTDPLHMSALGYPVTVQRERTGDALCVTLRAQPADGLLAAVSIRGRSCALVSE